MTTTNIECFEQAFNIGGGDRITLLELVKSINNGLQSNIKPIFKENRLGDISHSNANINKAINMLGYKVSVNFKDGISQIINLNYRLLTFQKILKNILNYNDIII